MLSSLADLKSVSDARENADRECLHGWRRWSVVIQKFSLPSGQMFLGCWFFSALPLRGKLERGGRLPAAEWKRPTRRREPPIQLRGSNLVRAQEHQLSHSDASIQGEKETDLEAPLTKEGEEEIYRSPSKGKNKLTAEEEAAEAKQKKAEKNRVATSSTDILKL